MTKKILDKAKTNAEEEKKEFFFSRNQIQFKQIKQIQPFL